MNFPHEYSITATASQQGNVTLGADHLAEIESAPPKEFGGPGDQWSPEDLLVASIADCFVLSFRAISRMSKLDWTELECHATGTLDKVDRNIQFVGYTVKAKLTVPSDVDEGKAIRVMEKAKATCFVTNSLNAEAKLEAEVVKA